jgi:hypothetical protein
MRPSEERITPDPSTCWPVECTVIDTTLCSASAATLASELPLLALAEVVTPLLEATAVSPSMLVTA